MSDEELKAEFRKLQKQINEVENWWGIAFTIAFLLLFIVSCTS